MTGKERLDQYLDYDTLEKFPDFLDSVKMTDKKRFELYLDYIVQARFSDLLWSVMNPGYFGEIKMPHKEMSDQDRADRLIEQWKKQFSPTSNLGQLDELCLMRAIKRNFAEIREEYEGKQEGLHCGLDPRNRR